MKKLTPIRCGRELINCKESYTQDQIQQMFLKLGQLEDIEEELGIDLITLFKALKNGVWYYDNHGQLLHDYVWLVNNYLTSGASNKLSFSFRTFLRKKILLFKDYGKTWSLNKGDLENE